MPGLSTQEAKARVDAIYQKVAQRWQERVAPSEFMQRFREGTLPLEVLRIFFKNWGAYTIEINTLMACGYHKHLTFFKQHRDLMAAMGEKIADEFMHPRPPGHFLIMFETAQALGLTESDLCEQPMLAEFRGKIDFARTLLYEGTTAEWFAGQATEEMMGHWAGECYGILTTKYGFTPEQAIYFSTHHQADLEEHEGSVMGHASFNRLTLQRLLETGEAWERKTYGLEYCAVTPIDLHALLLRGAVDAAAREALAPA
jgi:pyrroloquinoline quinone (PQQ) biosynthesis protein C